MDQPKLSRGVKIDNKGNLIWMWTEHYPTYITGVNALGTIYFFVSQANEPRRKQK